MLSKLSALAALVCVVQLSAREACVRDEQQLFAKWFEHQIILQDVDPDQKHVTKNDNFSTYYAKHAHEFAGIKPLVNACFKQDETRIIPLLIAYKMRNWLSKKIKKFIEFLQCKNTRFIDQVQNKHELRRPVTQTIRTYNKFASLLVADQPRDPALFAIANRMFEYCYGDGFATFKQLLAKEQDHQVARFLLAIMWFQLVGEGWHNWHADSLANIVAAARTGRELVYMAGGNDIKAPLEALVLGNVKGFRITMIDPILPSQERYYAEDYDWWVTGELGDAMTLKINGIGYRLVRSAQTVDGAFDAHLSTGEICQLPKSTTTWELRDSKNTCLGNVVFERRYGQQHDLERSMNEVAYIISFNELYFVAVDKAFGGWGFEVADLPENTSFLVKQLRRPVPKKMVCNIKYAEREPCYFIQMGSDPT